MRKLLFALFCICLLLAAPARADDVRDLKGRWVSEATTMASEEIGLFRNPGPRVMLVIEKQLGRVFSGYKTWTLDGEQHKEKLAGAIARDHEVYLIEEKDGESHGDYDVAEDSLILYYLEGGSNLKVVETIYSRK